MSEPDWQTDIRRLKERERTARAILGVSETADAAEIRHAFRQASLVCHPDVNPDDRKAADRFHLVCCAYKFLTEGETCADLDGYAAPAVPHTDGKYRRDNPWGYWCWWRETYFDGPARESDGTRG